MVLTAYSSTIITAPGHKCTCVVRRLNPAGNAECRVERIVGISAVSVDALPAEDSDIITIAIKLQSAAVIAFNHLRITNEHAMIVIAGAIDYIAKIKSFAIKLPPTDKIRVGNLNKGWCLKAPYISFMGESSIKLIDPPIVNRGLGKNTGIISCFHLWCTT